MPGDLTFGLELTQRLREALVLHAEHPAHHVARELALGVLLQQREDPRLEGRGCVRLSTRLQIGVHDLEMVVRAGGNESQKHRVGGGTTALLDCQLGVVIACRKVESAVEPRVNCG